MSAQLTSAEPPITQAERAQDARYCRDILLEMIGIGAEHARLALQRDQARTAAEIAQAAENPQPAATLGAGAAAEPEAAGSYDRITRSIRRSVMLLQRLGEPAAQLAAGDPVPRRVAARKRILRDMEDEIEREWDGPEADSLHHELLERLDSPDLDQEIDTREIAEIIVDIRRDLGLAPRSGTRAYYKRRTPADIVNLCARATSPGASVPCTAAAPGSVPIARLVQPGGDAPDLAELALALLNGTARLPTP